MVEIEGPKDVKIEPDSESGSERSEGSESVIKRNPTSVPAEESPDSKTMSVKNELIASPMPAVNSASLSEQEFAVVSQTLQSALSGPRYFTTIINAAATVGATIPTTTTSDPRYRPETLDIRQGYLCPPCGIRFSSLSTLEAHQTYYCSHRQKKINKAGGTESDGEDGRAVSVSGYHDQDECSSGENTSAGEPASKNVKTGKQYRCTHCSYSADKKVSLNRHMRMHSASPASSVQNDSDSSAPPVDCYCQECDIRFSNLKTFRAHKLHYCSTRNVIKRSSNANPSTSPALPADSRVVPPLPLPQLTFGLPNHNSSQTFVALPTNPVLIVPYSLIQSGSVLSSLAISHLSSQEAVYLLLPDGSIQIVTQGIVNQNVRIPEASSPVLLPLLTTNNNQVRKESTSPKNAKPVSMRMSNEALDLRTRRESNCNECTALTDISSEEEKENRLIDDQTEHENIVCAPSIPLMLATSSNCSTPSPMPPMPLSPLDARPDKQCSPSPKSVIKNVKKLTNGVIHHIEGIDEKKLENGATRVGSATAAPAAAAAGRLNVNFNLSEMLLAAVSQNPGAVKELCQFPPEMISPFTALQQLGSTKRPALNPIANMPLLVPHVSAAPGVLPDLLNPSILPLLTSELAIRLTAGSVAPTVPPFVRQGWKCDDCTISFCKYENYVAHKKHYCKTRKFQDLSAVQQQQPPPSQQQSEDRVKTSPLGSPSLKTAAVSPQPFSNENTNPAPHPTNVIQNTTQPPPGPQFTHLFICSMCGIKFNSLDNLNTHQTFYCSNSPDRIAIADTGGDRSTLKCPKCKVLLPVDQLPAHQCTGVGNAASATWKCPCCLVVCTSTNAIQKHFESHTGVKAFLCTICNYKGNTIRGMRTHIRVHFDKRNGEIMEENYITCLLDEMPSITTVNPNYESSSTKSPTEQEQARSTPSEGKVSPPANGLSPAPLVADRGEDEDEYIEVDELPLVKEEAPPRREVDDCKSSPPAAAPVDSMDYVPPKKSGPNYCNSCDIKFNYPSTFVAHKKYYCSSHASEVSPPLSVAETLVIPKNMATAAHSV